MSYGRALDNVGRKLSDLLKSGTDGSPRVPILFGSYKKSMFWGFGGGIAHGLEPFAYYILNYLCCNLIVVDVCNLM